MAPRSSDPRPALMTVAQVAAYLQLNKLTVYKYIREGWIPASKLGKAYRVRLADVEAFVESHKLRPAARRTSPADAPRARRQAPAPEKHAEEIAVGPQRQDQPDPRERAEITINPMEWVIRGLH